MFQFLLDNPILLIVLVLIFMALLVVFGFSTKKKEKKVEKVFPSAEKKETEQNETDIVKESIGESDLLEKQEGEIIDTSQITTKVSEDTEEKTSEIKEEKKRVKILKEKLKPKVEKVFKKEQTETDIKEQTETSANPEISEDDLLGRMQFVKSSKKVSKLKAYTKEELEQKELLGTEAAMLTHESLAEIEDIHEEQMQNKPKHFDRSRRLSRCIECGSVDELFCPHLSERYLNINSDRHLKLGGNFEEALYARTTKMLANSGTKFMCEDDDEEENYTPSKAFKNDKEYMKEWLEKKRREEFAKLVVTDNSASEVKNFDAEPEVMLNTKTLIMAGSIMKRKSVRNKF